MKHLVISDYGTYLGLSNQRLYVKQQDNIKYYPLNRLCTVSIAKRGVSISSDLIEMVSARGIKLFFLDFRGVAHSALLGESQHGVVAIRIAQMKAVEKHSLSLAKIFVTAKLKNQRAVINYYHKYHAQAALIEAANEINLCITKSASATDIDTLLGFEGAAASAYFQALRQARLLSSTFIRREGRGSHEINNSMMNIGYAVLSSYLLNCIINAGLEPYLGVMHKKRPGKMSLVLDLMEEYRAWVVDRAVIKLRQQSENKTALSPAIKKILIGEIQKTCAKKYLYRGKKLKLEHIMQRQVYRLCGCFYENKAYKPYLFKW